MALSAAQRIQQRVNDRPFRSALQPAHPVSQPSLNTSSDIQRFTTETPTPTVAASQTAELYTTSLRDPPRPWVHPEPRPVEDLYSVERTISTWSPSRVRKLQAKVQDDRIQEQEQEQVQVQEETPVPTGNFVPVQSGPDEPLPTECIAPTRPELPDAMFDHWKAEMRNQKGDMYKLSCNCSEHAYKLVCYPGTRSGALRGDRKVRSLIEAQMKLLWDVVKTAYRECATETDSTAYRIVVQTPKVGQESTSEWKTYDASLDGHSAQVHRVDIHVRALIEQGVGFVDSDSDHEEH